MKNIQQKILAAGLTLFFLGVLAYITFYMSNHEIAMFASKGMIGIKEGKLIITASWLMLIVVVPVFIFALVFAWRYRARKGKGRHDPDWEHNYIAEYCWWGVPCFIILILAIITWKSSHELSPFKPIESDKPALVVQVVALDWKWLFIYPEQGVAAVNFAQFPEQVPLSFDITADAPMNSFWIPQLGGQIYAMPGMRSKLHLIANEMGTFRGSAANISGEGFAGMVFTAKASTQEEFDLWVKSVRGSGKPLNLETYEQLKKPSSYHPVEYYRLEEKDLFDQILMKYMMP